MKKFLLVSLFALIGITNSYSQQFVYQARNPNFGGNTFNYQWLLSSAQVQDTNVDPAIQNRESAQQRNALSDFSESLNRQILSRLSRELVLRQFGEGDIKDGNYVIGDFQIDIVDGGSGLNITIVDITTGATTVVEVPFN